MPFYRKKSYIDRYLEEQKNEKKTVIDEINEALNSVTYICPSKEDCKYIESHFNVLRELLKKGKGLNSDEISEIINKVNVIVEKYPSTLKDGICFGIKDSENSSNKHVPEKILKDISKKCGLIYGQTTRTNAGKKYKNKKNKLITVGHHLNRFIEKLKNQNKIIGNFTNANTNNEKSNDQTFIELRAEIENELRKFKPYIESIQNKIKGKFKANKCVLGKLYEYTTRLSSISEVIKLSIDKLENKKDNQELVLAFGIGKFSLWGVVCRLLYHEDEYGQFSVKEAHEIDEEIKKDSEIIKKYMSEITSGKNLEKNDNVNVDIWSNLYEFKVQTLSLCKKIQNIRSQGYINNLEVKIREKLKYIKKIKIEQLDENLEMKEEINFTEMNKTLAPLGIKISKLERLKSMKIMHRVKLWVKNNWLKVIQGVPDDVEKLKKKLKSVGINI